MEQTQHEPDWEFHFRSVDNKPGSIAVDLGLAKIAPVAEKPNLLQVAVKIVDPRPDGLSSLQETIVLQSLEDDLEEELRTSCQATYAGRLTSNGHRKVYFYMGEPNGYADHVQQVMKKYSGHDYTHKLVKDAAWNRYFNFLYPEPEQLQSIKNRKVLEELESNGDDLSKERQVDHWIYFKTEADRSAFLQSIAKDNYALITSDYLESSEDYPHRLHISRTDKIDQQSIDKIVLHLRRLARKHNGDYDGWETSIEV
ncbi:DUF695 domain-containing protein [Pontibacter anaerobius]|uniref:DUF695 domain-containing protein n=1 Tax=Pontibacter anaerobius TaxID=2993940 RepID=A0ABT3RFD0_9BACT|nr:DUF695 domain-containing protein [Pontibacter anaerobius]MCX2740552.1 DUF695 domain-containing protein [Pontibacter anaerobius]